MSTSNLNKLLNILNSFPDLILLQDIDGIFTDVFTSNPDILPIPSSKFIGKDFTRIFPEHFAVKAEDSRKKCLIEQTTQTIEFSSKRGITKLFFEVRIVPGDQSTIVIIREITQTKNVEWAIKNLEKKYESLLLEFEELKKKEEQSTKLLQKEIEIHKQQVEKSEDIDHNIRTFMNGVLGFADILREESKELDNQTYYLFADTIFNNGKKLLSLIDFNISNGEGAGKLQLDLKPCSTAELIPKIFEKFKEDADKKNIKLTFSDRSKYLAYADESKLFETLSIFVDNSILHSEASNILIESGYDINKEKVVIKIKDNGIGIESSKLTNLFSPFKSDQKKTSPFIMSGLGIPTAKRMLELMRGEVEIQSKVGKGTEVIIYLPASEKTEEGITVRDTIFFASSYEIVFLSKFQPLILIVEDDNSSRRMLEITLSKVAKINLAKDGEEALDLIRLKNRSGQIYDLILLDIGLPIPWDGISLRNEIITQWEDYQKIPFIAQTAFAMSEDKNRILKAGFNAYIAKPIDRRDLIKTIANLLQQKTTV